MNEVAGKIIFIIIILLSLFVGIMYATKIKPSNEQRLIISIISIIVLLLLLLISFKVFPKTKKEKYENEQDDYVETSANNKEVYLYSDNFKGDGTLSTYKQHLKSINITDEIASYQMLIEAAANGMTDNSNIWSWGSDGYYYRYDSDAPGSFTISESVNWGGVWLYGVKPPYAKYKNCENSHAGEIPCIHPWSYINRYFFYPRVPNPGPNTHPRPEVYYTEINDSSLFDFTGAKIAAEKMKMTIATPYQIQDQIQAASYNNLSFSYPNKNGWASDGKLYKTADPKTLSAGNVTSGGIFFFGVKPNEGVIHAITNLIALPFQYKNIWSKFDACGNSCDSSCKCPDGTVCDNNFSICAPPDCSNSSIQCPQGYQTTKSCIPI
jgi:hypothetical protein